MSSGVVEFRWNLAKRLAKEYGISPIQMDYLLRNALDTFAKENFISIHSERLTNSR